MYYWPFCLLWYWTSSPNPCQHEMQKREQSLIDETHWATTWSTTLFSLRTRAILQKRKVLKAMNWCPSDGLPSRKRTHAHKAQLGFQKASKRSKRAGSITKERRKRVNRVRMHCFGSLQLGIDQIRMLKVSIEWENGWFAVRSLIQTVGFSSVEAMKAYALSPVPSRIKIIPREKY